MKKVTVVTVSLLLLLTACSSGSTKASPDSSTSTTAIPTTEAAPASGPRDSKLEANARAFLEAFKAGDVDALVDLYSTRCRKAVSRSNLEAFTAKAKQDYADVTVTKVTSHVDGTNGSVDYVMSDPQLSRKAQRWVLEDGSWHNDQC